MKDWMWVERTEERFYEARLHQLRGDFLFAWRGSGGQRRGRGESDPIH